jgi:hypothetical protein
VGFCRTTRRSSEPDVDPLMFAAMDLAKSLPDNWRRVTLAVEVERAAEGPPEAVISFCEIEEGHDQAEGDVAEPSGNGHGPYGHGH